MKLIVLTLLLTLSLVHSNLDYKYKKLYKWANYDLIKDWSFSWTSMEYSYDKNQVPDVKLDFGNGTSELYELTWYSPVEGIEKECNFLGKMKRDPSFNIVVNGCPDDPYIWAIADTPVEAYANVMRNHLVPESRSNNESMNLFENEDDLDENEDDEDEEAVDFENLLMGDELMKSALSLEEDKLAEDRHGNLTGTKFDPAQEFQYKLPENLYFRIGIAVENGAYKELGIGDKSKKMNLGNKDVEKKMLAIFISHMQFIYYMKSLGTKITFDTPVPIITFPEWECNFGKFKTCNQLFAKVLNEVHNDVWKKHGNLQHLLGLGKWRGGMMGISAVGGVCNSRTTRSISKLLLGRKILEGPISYTPRILAHEMTHNVGFGHVAKPLCGFGHFMGGGGYSQGWSICHNTVMRAKYDHFTRKGGYCMDREDPSKAGGSWEPWSSYGKCIDCKQSRYRVCVGVNCPGKNMEERLCPKCT